MRMYFTACVPAALKINGEYAGTADLFERYVELNIADSVLVELVPGDNLQPVNFFADERLLSAPPEFLDVYLGDGEAMVYVKRFESRPSRIKIIAQTRFSGNLITVFSQGDVYLSVDGADCRLEAVGSNFSSAEISEKSIDGRPVSVISGNGAIIILNERGEIIFFNVADSAEFGKTLKITVRFQTCTDALAHLEYAYADDRLKLIKSRTEERATANSPIQFAFFESVLVCADVEKYLSGGLRGRGKDLKGYLGEFAGVIIPTEKFRLAHPDELAAGLIYPKLKNLFEIKYYAVTLAGGKIDNIYPVE